MRLIDADNLKDRFMAAIVPDVYKPSYSIAEILVEIDHEPTVDAVPVVRCKDCKHSERWYRDKRLCHLWSETGIDVFEDGYCSYGERRRP